MLLINDQFLGLNGEVENCEPQSRTASRAVVFNDEGKLALLYVDKHGHHKLPGGGVEQGESYKLALVREIKEEIGCDVSLRDLEVGFIKEERDQHRFTQTSYCGIADIVSNGNSQSLDDHEIEDGMSAPKWVTIEEAMGLFESDRPKTYVGKFMHARDQAFVAEVERLLK